MLRDPTGGESDSEPSPTEYWIDHARRVIAQEPQPYDYNYVDFRSDVLGFEKPPELVVLWPTWLREALYFPTDFMAYRLPYLQNEHEAWVIRDRATGMVWQAPTNEQDSRPHPLLLPSLAACLQAMELICGQICDLWGEGLTPAERLRFGPAITTFRPRTRAYPPRPWHPDMTVDP